MRLTRKFAPDEIQAELGRVYEEYSAAGDSEAEVEFLKMNQIRHSVIRVLQALVDVSRNCGENAGFDFKKSNFGVNEYGTLIFRDVFWVRS